jgi:hypothetical protein
MGTLTGANLIDRIQDTLQDTTSVRWPEAELLRYINDAQREIVNFKPEASATHANIALSAGTEQSIPSGGLRLIKVTRNMSGTASDATGKRAIRIVDIDILNSQEPDWHDPDAAVGDAAHGTNVKHYAFDPDDPKKFYVYPGVSGDAYLEIVYSGAPTDLSATSDTISLDDIYGNAIIDFVLYKAYLKDSEYAGNAQRAGTHYQLFTASISGGGQAQITINPNMDRMSSTPSSQIPRA